MHRKQKRKDGLSFGSIKLMALVLDFPWCNSMDKDIFHF